MKSQRLDTHRPCSRSEEGLLELKVSDGTGRKNNQSDFEHGVHGGVHSGVHGGWRQAGCTSQFFTNCWRFFATSQPSLRFTENARSPPTPKKAKKLPRELWLMICSCTDTEPRLKEEKTPTKPNWKRSREDQVDGSKKGRTVAQRGRSSACATE